jgi:hypothetical protein
MRFAFDQTVDLKPKTSAGSFEPGVSGSGPHINFVPPWDCGTLPRTFGLGPRILGFGG